MAEKIFLLVNSVANIFLLIAFVFSLFITKKTIGHSVFFLIPIYLFFAFVINIIEVLDSIGISKFSIFNEFCNLIFVVIHFLFLTTYIIKSIDINKQTGLLKVFQAIFIFTISFMAYFDFFNHTYYSATATNIGVMILCIFYYYNMLKNITFFKIGCNSTFLIITGIMFSSCFLIPIILFGNYIRSVYSLDTFYYLAILAPLGSMVMYIFFIKAFLCIKSQEI
jgi:hypothetical protein